MRTKAMGRHPKYTVPTAIPGVTPGSSSSSGTKICAGHAESFYRSFFDTGQKGLRCDTIMYAVRVCMPIHLKARAYPKPLLQKPAVDRPAVP